MPCVTQSCQQGRAKCGTPLICEQGLHRHDGPFHHHEPVPTPEEAEGWGITFAWAVLAVLVIACVIGPLYFGVMP